MMSSALKVFFAISLPRSFHDIRFLFPFTTYFLDQFWGGRSSQYERIVRERLLDQASLLAFAKRYGFIVLKGEESASNHRATEIGKAYFVEWKKDKRAFIKISLHRTYCDIHIDLLPIGLPVAREADPEYGPAFSDYFNRVQKIVSDWIRRLKLMRVSASKMELEVGDWTVIHHVPVDQALYIAIDLFSMSQDWVKRLPAHSLDINPA